MSGMLTGCSVPQEAQQGQSIHSHLQRRRAQAGQFCSTLWAVAVGRAMDKQLSEVTVKESTHQNCCHCLLFVCCTLLFVGVTDLIVVASGV